MEENVNTKNRCQVHDEWERLRSRFVCRFDAFFSFFCAARWLYNSPSKAKVELWAKKFQCTIAWIFFFSTKLFFFLSFRMCLLGRAGSSRALRDGWGRKGEKFNFGSPSRSPNSYKNEREPRLNIQIEFTWMNFNSPKSLHSDRGTKILRSANSFSLSNSLHPSKLPIYKF